MWNKIKWHLQRFMIGRNGRDELQIAVLYASFILYAFAGLLDRLFPFPLFRIIGWLGVVYSIYRFCSNEFSLFFRSFESRRNRAFSSHRVENSRFRRLLNHLKKGKN